MRRARRTSLEREDHDTHSGEPIEQCFEEWLPSHADGDLGVAGKDTVPGLQVLDVDPLHQALGLDCGGLHLSVGRLRRGRIQITGGREIPRPAAEAPDLDGGSVLRGQPC